MHQRWPAEHLLPSPPDKLHFSFQPKDTREAVFSPFFLLHKYFLSHYLEKFVSLNWLIRQLPGEVYIHEEAVQGQGVGSRHSW